MMYLIVFATILIVGAISNLNFNIKSAKWPSTAGEIVSDYYGWSYTSGSWHVTYQYKVEGTTYKAHRTYPHSMPKEYDLSNLTVYYNPANPKSSTLFPGIITLMDLVTLWLGLALLGIVIFRDPSDISFLIIDLLISFVLTAVYRILLQRYYENSPAAERWVSTVESVNTPHSPDSTGGNQGSHPSQSGGVKWINKNTKQHTDKDDRKRLKRIAKTIIEGQSTAMLPSTVDEIVETIKKEAIKKKGDSQELAAGRERAKKWHLKYICDDLHPILEKEYERGNYPHWPISGDEGPPSAEGFGYIIQLDLPFRANPKEHDLPDFVIFTEKHNPHYWDAEYHCQRHNHTLVDRFDANYVYKPWR